MAHESPLPYLDPDCPLAERVSDLVSRMTLSEKCSQLLADSPAIDRLNVPAYHWWNECLHGVARAGRATVFPQAIGLAAAFDIRLMERIGAAISDEARAKYHAAQRAGMRGQYRGLTFWTPNVNIFRDPRWGRGQETYGEDPFLAGELGASFVTGLQQEHNGYLKAAGCAKHYAVHSGPEAERHTFNARVTAKDLRETYLPAFERLVQAGVEAVMGAYNRTNNEACCASELLLEQILRGEWGFEGHVVSDCGAIGDIHDYHQITGSAEESAALAVSRGCDLNCGSTYKALPAAIEQGLIEEAAIDTSLTRLLRTRFRLGQFDPPERVPWSTISTDVIRSPEHIRLAREAAEKSIVLLKNNGALPLDRGEHPTRLYVTGPNAASTDVLLGNYFGVSESLVTILEAIVAEVPEHFTVEYRMGMLAHQDNVNPVDWSTPGKWDNYDAVIAVAGLVPMLEGEEGEAILSAERGDRTDIGLPQHQIERLRKIKDQGHTLIVILTGGSPVAIEELSGFADAILFAWYPGEQGGPAVARLLFGDVSPSGKLPVTFPRSVAQLPPYEDYAMQGRTYRYMEEEPLYPFGFGLTYTTFAYADGSAPTSVSLAEVSEGVTVTATILNTGPVSSAEAAQCYISRIDSEVRTPLASLCGIQRLFVPAGKSVELSFTLPPAAFELVGEDGSRAIEPGRYQVSVGSCSPGTRAVELGAPEPTVVELAIIQ
jgi:beta-glucosidase